MHLFRIWCVVFGLLGSSYGLDREAFTFTNYNLEVRVEPEQQRLAVRGKVTLRNDSSTPQKNLSLQISSTLDWRSIQIGGQAVPFVSQPYTSDIDHTGALSEAIVTMPQEVPPRSTVELEIGYEGTIRLDGTRLKRIGVPEEVAKHSDWDEIGKRFTAVRGVGYVVWYPVAMDAVSLSEENSVFAALGRWKAREAEASLRINLCAARELSDREREADAPSVLMNEPPHSEGKGGGSDGTACSEHLFQPLEKAVPLFVISEYATLDRPGLDIHYLAGHKASAENFGLASEVASPLVAEWFGEPKHKAEVAEVADSDAAPFENGSMLLTPLAGNDSRLYRLLAIHQLTHAAYPSPRLWVYEGLAHFAQAVDREEQSGRQAALDFMGLHRTTVADAEKAVAARPGTSADTDESLINTTSEEFYRSKAMCVWWMLRDMIGDDALKKALATYHGDQDKEPSYMQRLIEAQAKKDLEWFFDDWVYRDRGLPDFRVESAYVRETVNGGAVVTITVQNLGSAGAEVPIILRMETGEVSKRLEVRAKAKASIRMEASSAPRVVVVNDGSVAESDMSNNTYEVQAPPK